MTTTVPMVSRRLSNLREAAQADQPAYESSRPERTQVTTSFRISISIVDFVLLQH
jgi:hypothetical protein